MQYRFSFKKSLMTFSSILDNLHSEDDDAVFYTIRRSISSFNFRADEKQYIIHTGVRMRLTGSISFHLFYELNRGYLIHQQDIQGIEVPQILGLRYTFDENGIARSRASLVTSANIQEPGFTEFNFIDLKLTEDGLLVARDAVSQLFTDFHGFRCFAHKSAERIFSFKKDITSDQILYDGECFKQTKILKSVSMENIDSIEGDDEAINEERAWKDYITELDEMTEEFLGENDMTWDDLDRS
jgi:hypothetical protein